MRSAAAAKTARISFDGAAKMVRYVSTQAYKSKDAKRQNADIANAANAYARNYLPSNMLFSRQIDGDIAERYVRAQ